MADFEYPETGFGTYSNSENMPDEDVRSGKIGKLINATGALMSVALVAGVSVWGYNLLTRDASGVPVVRALDGPMRVRPDNPGGIQAAHQGLAVNRVQSDGVTANAADRLVLAPDGAGVTGDDPAGLRSPAPIMPDNPAQAAIEIAAPVLLPPQENIQAQPDVAIAPSQLPATNKATAEALKMADQLAQGGVKFVLNCAVDADIFTAIRAEHDAVIIATGVYKSRDLDLPGNALQGVEKAIDFLTASNRKSFGDEVAEFDSGRLNADGKRVVVIGGGDTAMDCVRTSIRQGATSVKCLYRRDRANMPGSLREVTNAEEEGVIFEWLSAPMGFQGDDKVTGVMVQKMRLGAPDATGRQAPEVIEGADYVEDADLVIKALGFEPEDLPTMWDQPELPVTGWGTIRAEHNSGATEMPGVYAVGDIVRGASLVVWAIRDGRDCAAAILDQLNTNAAVAAE